MDIYLYVFCVCLYRFLLIQFPELHFRYLTVLEAFSLGKCGTPSSFIFLYYISSLVYAKLRYCSEVGFQILILDLFYWKHFSCVGFCQSSSVPSRCAILLFVLRISFFI